MFTPGQKVSPISEQHIAQGEFLTEVKPLRPHFR